MSMLKLLVGILLFMLLLDPAQAQPPQRVFCLQAASMYHGTNAGAQSGEPFTLFGYDSGWLVNNQRSVAAPGMIDLAWGPDFQLYGITNEAAQLAPDRSALYRIDPTTGAATKIGAVTGIGAGLQDGDLATFPYNRRIYGVDGDRFFQLPMAGGVASPAGQVVAHVNIPPGWTLVGLASPDTSPKFYAIAEPPPASPLPARLLTLGPNGVISASVDLPFRVGSTGALEWVAGRLLFAQGSKPSPLDSTGQAIYEIDANTGAMNVVADTGAMNGLGALVSCAPDFMVCLPPPPDLVAWYTMDSVGTDRILGNNAVASGSGSYASGFSGQSARLGPTYFTVPPARILNLGRGPFTIDAWIRVTPLSTGTLLDKRVGNVGWALFLSPGRRLALMLANGSSSSFISTGAISNGWHHVAVTVDREAADGVRFYVDGLPAGSADPRSRAGSIDTAGPMYIGRDVLTAAIASDTLLDEIDIFDRVLAPWEIASIANASYWGKCKVP